MAGPREPGDSAATVSTAAPPVRTRFIHIALLLLSFSAGAADAFAFLALGGIFTANMTGNLILTGMFTRAEFGTTLWTAVVAILVFTGVLYAAFRLTATGVGGPASPRRVMRRLILPSIVVQTVVVLIWLPFHGQGLLERGVVIALACTALALQTVGARKLSDVDGITTTYVTGTLTTTMQDLAERRQTGQPLRILSVLALPIGAVCGTAALAFATWSGPLVPWISATIATVLLALSRRRSA
ncbi:DUF1275 family protein [Amnibacterium flavum]|uniref:DUF1275 domain-containing protein n=1 Tax=Amnibacterium flavum TaxID=2173173 RepID=A0A2V1HUL2_9MICO|nr:DUF1275 family protein [Amnibacterium flavum]PVZ95382.1 hypothetical protein DDQ50_02360 [Amnibacterium flavum]